MLVEFDPRVLRNRMLIIAVLMTVMGLAAEVCDAVWQPDWGPDVVVLLSVSYEKNLPTWYASTLLAISALMTALTALHVGQNGQRHPRRWMVLALALAYVSFDEAVELHEEMSTWFDTSGVLYFGWVMPAAAAVLVLGIYMWPWLHDLPRPARARFVLSGVCYVGGALVMELPLGYWTEMAGADNLVYAAIDAVEECLELAGISLYLYALLSMHGPGPVRVSLRPTGSSIPGK